MRLHYLLTATLLLGGAAPALAQSTAPTDHPFYIGLTAYSSPFQPLGGRSSLGGSSRTTVPVQLVVGYQLRPRWAVQVGAAYTGYRQEYSSLGRYAEPGGANGYDFSYNGAYTVRKLSVTLLGRYTLTRQLTRRLQVDVLGGAIYEHGSVHDVGLFASNQGGPLLTHEYDSVVRDNRLLVGLGSGLRFRAARQFDIMLDVVFSSPLYGHSNFDLTSATALGLRYRLGHN